MLIPVVAHSWSSGDAASYPVRNVTPGGAYLVTAERWYPGTIVSLSFRYDPAYLQVANINGNAKASIMMRAKVTRHGEDGVGVQFVYINSGERKAFEQFLAGAKVRSMA